MTAFDNAWTLLKNRGFEMDPRYEDERERQLEEIRYSDDPERDELLSFPNQYIPPKSKQGLYELRYYDDLERQNRLRSQTGPMYQQQQDQEAERIEAEGIDLPDVPSSAPPVDIGRAGSLTPEPFRPDLEQTKQRMSPLGQALAQARSQPPQPLQFEKAWATLKADPNMLDTQGRSIPPALANPQNFNRPPGDAERSFQSIRDAMLAAETDMPYYDNLRQYLLARIHRTSRPSAYHFLQNANEEERENMRQNERRFGPLSSILAQDTDKGREFYQYRGPDVSNMYAPVPQPE
tara:strand:- start:112 stop:987 length:876 start_codon:yes stop_codon:yes gene_type:complete